MTALRVLHVTDNYPPAVGGLERHVQTLSRALAGADVRAAVATLQRPGVPGFELDPTDGRVEIWRLKSLTSTLRRAAPASQHYFVPPVPDLVLTRQLQGLLDRLGPDIVHTHSWSLTSALRLHLPPGTRLVHTMHEYGLVCAKQTYTREPTGCSVGPSLRACLPCSAKFYPAPKAALATVGLRGFRHLNRSVDRFIAISAAVAQAGAPATFGRPVDVIPTFTPDGLTELARTASPPDGLPTRPFILFVGAMGPHKGFDLLLDVWRHLPDRPPLVVCGTTRADTPELDCAGLEPADLVLLRDVPHAQVMATWRRAAVGVVPSVWPEPFGQVAVEGLAAGTPMIVSRTGGLGEVIEHDVNGISVPPNDPAALRAALTRLLTDAGARARFAQAGPLRAARFSIGAVLPQIMATYDAALAAPPQSRRHI
jgi:glycosyltransferase involved in cell wall biosynthesis